jgi:hypothetical protein
MLMRLKMQKLDRRIFLNKIRVEMFLLKFYLNIDVGFQIHFGIFCHKLRPTQVTFL